MPTPSDPHAETSNKQFSSDKEGDPVKLLQQSKDCIQYHADMNEAYGLCQPAATLGSHAWLRDSLATPDEKEPGNASPSKADKEPFRS